MKQIANLHTEWSPEGGHLGASDETPGVVAQGHAAAETLDEPDSSLDAIWAEEAELRLKAYRKGRLEGVPMEEVFQDK